MKLLNKGQLEKLTTARLLAYKNRLLQVPAGPDWDDGINPSQINKTSPEWIETYANLKEILGTREHVKK